MISNRSNASVGVVTASRVTLSGWLKASKKNENPEDRYVTVQGLAERTVLADRATWTLRLQAFDADADKASASLARQIRTTETFLEAHGLRPADWDTGKILLTRQPRGQCRAACKLRIDTSAVWSAATAYEDVSVLLAKGIEPLRMDNPTYHLTTVAALAPELATEAAARARASAESHARETHTRLKGLRRAHQGNIEILADKEAATESEAQRIVKRLRVVSTLEFRLA